MLNKILFVILLGVFAGLAPAEAQTAPTAPARVKGKIVAARVQGHVEAILTAGGVPRVLHDGDLLSDQTQVVTSSGASVILVFSNGATVNVSEDSTLDIEKFEQDPFAGELNMGSLKQEPGTSTTKLNLAKGELVGKVVHLNVDKGSEFTVQTPVGAAGIRGTTFRIVFRPAKDGKAFFVVTTAEGVVVFKGVTSAPVSIPAGKTVVATFQYTPPAAGGTSGGTGSSGTGTSGTGTGSSGTGTGTGTSGGTDTSGGTGSTGTGTTTTPVTIVTTDTTPEESAQVETAAAPIVAAVAASNFTSSTTPAGSGSSGTGSSGTGSSGSGTGTSGTGTGSSGTGTGTSGGTDTATGTTSSAPAPAAPATPALSGGAGTP
jgi:hypothetical protein